MARQNPTAAQKVLIVSSHPLFGKGLQRLLQTRQQADVRVVGIVSSVDQAMLALSEHKPDLVVVDHDDQAVNRDEFLARFVEGEQRLRVVLLSLKEGGSEAIVYDRRSLAASQIDDWLKEWIDDRDIEVQKPEESGTTINARNLNRRGNMKHAIGAIIFVAVLTALGLLVLNTSRLLPVEASLQAVPIDHLFGLHFKIIAFLFALIIGLILYSVIFFRRKPGDTEDAPYIKGNSTLEFIWTIIPLGTVIAFAFLGSKALAETERIDPKALEIKVVGQQWAWRFEYPDQQIVSDKLMLPQNRQVLLRITSLDVIHSFWVPEFRLKQDALPGSERELRLTANLIGNYKVRCAEICGTRHAYMLADVQVMSGPDFDAWVAAQQEVANDPVARGQQLYEQYGCKACHSLDGTKIVGPSFKGIYGETVTFEDGTTATVDDAYLFESIREPAKHIVQGFPNVMPPDVAKDLTDAQVNDLIAFIKSLK
jgi:cytochrome c oxidase subunit 2